MVGVEICCVFACVGPYTFGVGLTTYLVSKEIYVLEHEYYTGLSILIMTVFIVKKLGPKFAAYLDKEIDVSISKKFDCHIFHNQLRMFFIAKIYILHLTVIFIGFYILEQCVVM
jgi:hypothetical protein